MGATQRQKLSEGKSSETSGVMQSLADTDHPQVIERLLKEAIATWWLKFCLARVYKESENRWVIYLWRWWKRVQVLYDKREYSNATFTHVRVFCGLSWEKKLEVPFNILNSDEERRRVSFWKPQHLRGFLHVESKETAPDDIRTLFESVWKERREEND